MLITFRIGGLYKSRLSVSLLDDMPYIGLGYGLSAVVTVWFGLGRGPSDSVLRRLLVFTAIFTSVLAVRAAAYWTIRWARRRGLVRHGCLIIGAGHIGLQVAEELRSASEFGLDTVGLVDSHPRVEHPEQLPAPLLGGYEDLADLIPDFAIKVVIVAFGTLRESELVEVLRTCDRLECEIMLVPRLFEIHTITRDMDQVRGIPLVRVRRAPFRRPSWRVKRLVDIVGSAAALLALSPLLLACAAAVRLEMGRGVLFRQARVGLDRREFTLLKFRSLQPASVQESQTTWNVKGDMRVGRVGRFLRSSSLDELPQLWNVIRGDMSLVGPRPERQHFVDDFSVHIPRYTGRYRVPAGLTGWAQVNGLRGDTSIKDRASFDNYYIENWSLWGDFKIMARTLAQVFKRAGG